MCALSFVGLFCSNELLNIRVCHITILSDYVTIRFPESKTDVYREGQDVVTHKSDNFTCPYRLLLRYLDVLISIFLCFQNYCLGTSFLLNLPKSMYWVTEKFPTRPSDRCSRNV